MIFLGDFIDRGPEQRPVIDIVRPMIDSGAALSVMGNHEFNAIAYATEDPEEPGGYLRPRTEKNRRQHEAFLAAYEDKGDYAELIQWFRHLPLWLELDGLRVVHACWDGKLMRFLEKRYRIVNDGLEDELLVAASIKGRPEFNAVETLLKGREVPLPRGQRFYDKDGNPRQEIRVKWWDAEAKTYREAFLGPDAALSHIPEDPLDIDHQIVYSSDARRLLALHPGVETVHEHDGDGRVRHTGPASRGPGSGSCSASTAAVERQWPGHPGSSGQNETKDARVAAPTPSGRCRLKFNRDGPDVPSNRDVNCPKGSDDVQRCSD